MKGTFYGNSKNVVISLLVGYIMSGLITWTSEIGKWVGAYLVAQMLFILLTAYDEIRRQRRRTMHHDYTI